MRALLFHCRNFSTQIDSLSNRPAGIMPESIEEKKQLCGDCVSAFITVESGDSEATAEKMSKEIAEMCESVGKERVMICPFAHLSKNIADSRKSIKILDRICSSLKKNFGVARAHFGSHKSLLLDVYGHPGNVRYREF
jgi:threonyl-tRNA synthetase